MHWSLTKNSPWVTLHKALLVHTLTLYVKIFLSEIRALLEACLHSWRKSETDLGSYKNVPSGVHDETVFPQDGLTPLLCLDPCHTISAEGAELRPQVWSLRLTLNPSTGRWPCAKCKGRH